MMARGNGGAGGACRALWVLSGLALAPIPAAALDNPPRAPGAHDLPASAIFIDGDDRLSPEEFGRQNNLNVAQLQARFGATGVVRCGTAAGTGQLVGSNGVVVTASHVLFEPGGHPRAEGKGCTFDIVVAGRHQVVPIETSAVVCGATEPYANPAIRDWAVAPLAKPVTGAKPYMLGAAMSVPGRLILAAAVRSGGVESHSLEACNARKVTNSSPGGQREVAVDCDAEGGTSGAAFLSDTGAFLGVYVGFRSAHPGTPGPFSMTHYNFGVTAEGGLRKAIIEATAKAQPLSASR